MSCCEYPKTKTNTNEAKMLIPLKKYFDIVELENLELWLYLHKGTKCATVLKYGLI